ncbi:MULTISPECIES: tRNA lysidine(34) synthetase TilS [Hyphobacterium]|uniref:tRNA(Ile)-lysidine synthase n=1 Tax=Hyphobacterium vulgare TaxID=1736751 RepID=A0ABV6ZZ43_9PROT
MPLGAETAARLDTLVTAPGPVLIGLSGGADSRTLLILAARWSRFSGRPLHALVCDHGFRRESAEDARRAAAMAETEGVPARIVRRDGAVPASGLQAEARQWRLTELAHEARRIGAATILLGHTHDDRAETVWMRLTAGAGLSGLATMRPLSPHPVWPDGDGLWIARPLIDQTRAGVRHWLSAQGLDWIDDPSNEDTGFQRIRVRRTLERLRARGLGTGRLTGLADSAGRIEDGLAAAGARLFLEAIDPRPWGGVRLDRARLNTAPAALRRRAVAAAIAMVSGASRPAPRGVEAVITGLECGGPATGGGAALTNWQGRHWLVREPGREPAAASGLPLGKSVAWDGRWQIASDCEGLDIGPLGADYSGYTGAAALDAVPGLARPTLGALRQGGTVLAVAGLDTPRSVRSGWLGPALAARTLFAGLPPAWFDRELALRTGAAGSRNSFSDAPYPRGSDLEVLET